MVILFYIGAGYKIYKTDNFYYQRNGNANTKKLSFFEEHIRQNHRYNNRYRYNVDLNEKQTQKSQKRISSIKRNNKKYWGHRHS